jgi:hypothetical protein
MAQRDNRHLGYLTVPPRSRRSAPLSGAAKHPAGARPSKCIIIIIIIITIDLVGLSFGATVPRLVLFSHP